MFKDLLKKLRSTKKELEVYQESKENEVIQEEKPKKTILITEENGFYKVVIDEPLSVTEYEEITKNSDKKKIFDLIGTTVVFKSNFTSTIKGTIYIKEIDNKLFNILFTDNEIAIRELSKDNMDDKEKSIILKNMPSRTKDNIGNHVYHDRKIVIFKNKNTYDYSHLGLLFDHDTYYVKVYSKDKKYGGYAFELDKSIVYEEIDTILNNLEGIDNIDTILDINLLRETILNDLKSKSK